MDLWSNESKIVWVEQVEEWSSSSSFSSLLTPRVETVPASTTTENRLRTKARVVASPRRRRREQCQRSFSSASSSSSSKAQVKNLGYSSQSLNQNLKEKAVKRLEQISLRTLARYLSEGGTSLVSFFNLKHPHKKSILQFWVQLTAALFALLSNQDTNHLLKGDLSSIILSYWETTPFP